MEIERLARRSFIESISSVMLSVRRIYTRLQQENTNKLLLSVGPISPFGRIARSEIRRLTLSTTGSHGIKIRLINN